MTAERGSRRRPSRAWVTASSYRPRLWSASDIDAKKRPSPGREAAAGLELLEGLPVVGEHAVVVLSEGEPRIGQGRCQREGPGRGTRGGRAVSPEEQDRVVEECVEPGHAGPREREGGVEGYRALVVRRARWSGTGATVLTWRLTSSPRRNAS